MRASLRIFKKELSELLRDTRSMLLVLLVPTLFVALVGQLHTPAYLFRVLVGGCGDSHAANICSEQQLKSLLLLQQITQLQLDMQPEPVTDPLVKMQSDRYDLVLNIENPSAGQWKFYTAEIDPVRLRLVRLLAQRLDSYLRVVHEKPQDPTPQQTDKQTISKSQMPVLVQVFNDIPTSSFFEYYSRPDSYPPLIPEITALIVCFLPVLITSSALIREAEQHTLEVLLTVPDVSPSSVFVGKAAHATTITLVVFLIILIEIQVVYGMGIKSGLLFVILWLLPAMVGSAFIGLAISAVCTSSAQGLLATGGYLVGMGIFSGFLYPVASGASGITIYVSRLFPLTFATPLLRSWMYGAGPAPGLYLTLLWLVAQAVAYGLVGIWTCRRMVRRI